MAKGRLVFPQNDPARVAQFAIAHALRGLGTQIDRVKQSQKSPTMPIYDPGFPDDAVNGQHALRAGRPRYFWDGEWRSYADLPWAYVQRTGISLSSSSGTPTGVDFDLANGSVDGAEDGSGVFTLGNNGSGDHGIVVNEPALILWSCSVQAGTTGSPAAGSVIGATSNWQGLDRFAGDEYAPFYAIPGGAPTYNFRSSLSEWLNADPDNVSTPSKGLVSITQNSGLTLSSVIVTFKAVKLSSYTSPDFT